MIQEVLDNRDSQSVHSPDKETRSLLSRQSTHHQSTTSPVKAPTPNPLKVCVVVTFEVVLHLN